jgi:hypothetical protein
MKRLHSDDDWKRDPWQIPYGDLLGLWPRPVPVALAFARRILLRRFRRTDRDDRWRRVA